MIIGYLISGAIEALVLVAVAYLLSRFTKDIIGRSLLAAFLFVAAAVYIVFAVRAGEGAYWVVGEAVGVGIYGTMALRGLRYSPLWRRPGGAGRLLGLRRGGGGRHLRHHGAARPALFAAVARRGVGVPPHLGHRGALFRTRPDVRPRAPD